MPTLWRRRLRRSRRYLVYGVAVLLVLAAMLVGVANQLLPLVERHPDRIAAWLSERVGQPVHFERVSASWTRRGPLLGLEQLRVGQGERAIQIGSAQLLVSVYSGLIPGRPLTELRVDAVALTLERDAGGRWQARGLSGRESQPGEDTLAALDGFGEIHVREAALRVLAPELDIDMEVPRLDLRLRSRGGRTRAGLLGWVGAGPPLTAVVDIDRGRGDGRVHLSGSELDFGDWAPLLRWAGVRVGEGRGRIALWLALGDYRVQSIQAEAEVTAVRFEGERPIPLEGAQQVALAPAVEVDRLRLGLRWWAGEGGWHLHAPLLRLQTGARDQVLDGFYLRGGGEVALVADQLQAGPLLALLALSDRLPDPLRRWLHLAAPELDVADLAVHRRGDMLRGRATVSGLAVAPVDEIPGIAGLAGNLVLDQDGLRWILEESPVRLDWPPNLVAALDLRLRGELQAWRGETGWSVGTEGLRVQGEDFAFSTRGNVSFGGERRRPRLDLAATVEPGPAVAAKRFWILGHMPPPAVEWLNGAIQGGHLLSGEAVVAGELDDWPFRDAEGVFEAVGHLEGLQLDYHEDWPRAEKVRGVARFTGVGFSVEIGAGEIAGVDLSQARAGLEAYSDPLLRIEAEGRGSGASLKSLLAQSPVAQTHDGHLQALEVGGRGRVAVDLRIPLREDLGPFRLTGTVDLADARLSDSRWNLDFSRASGRVRFSEAGFSAEELSVVLDGTVGSLSLAAGEFTSSPEEAFEASLRGRFDAADLIARQPPLAWLEDWIDGRSDWTIGVRVPAPEQGMPPRLQIQSDLVGAALNAPAPLRKGAEDALPLRVDVPLPVESGEMRVRLGQLLRLRGRLRDSGALDGTLDFGPVAESVAVGSGLHVRGQVPALDVAGWVALAVGDEPAERPAQEDGFRIASVDILAGQLDLLDNAFVDTRLQLERVGEHWQVRLDGPELLGSARIPTQLEDGIDGEFERLYWPSGRAARSNGVDVDPAVVPPLRLRIADLHFGDARLGRASLNTYPAPEGLHVQRFETEAPTQTIRASGHWTRIEGRAYSRFAVDFRAESLGRMLDALGYAGMVDGGRTEARLEAGWAGSPAAFSLERVEGSLRLDVGQGRILEVEPGAGRLLGLVSLAELPRRLVLDFSDFFGQGFSFNSIQGEFALGGGNARTEDLAISGPAADIRVRGRAGLSAQDYDQTIEVLPKTGGVLPVLGAVTGGPAGAAIGAVAQAILNRPMKEMSRTVYRVTGSWQAPHVEVLERGPTRETGGGGGAGTAAR